MALSPSEVIEVETVLGSAADAAGVVAALRRSFPTRTVTQCDVSDVDLETPFRVGPRTSLFLVDNADHCWRLTADPTRAGGFVVVANKIIA